MRKEIVNRRGFSIERDESICAKKGRAKSRNNPVISWYTGSRIWEKMKDNGFGNKKLLVARDYKIYRKIHGRMWYMLENKEQDRSTSREAEVEQGTRKTVDTSNSRLYYKVTSSSWERYNSSGL